MIPLLSIEDSLKLAGFWKDDSPCDSPIEDTFYAEIQKRLAHGASITRQVECITRLGRFYLDFLVEIHGRKVGFECDGRAYHEQLKDSQRDAAIIESGTATRIYRLRGTDIHNRLADALDLVAGAEPEPSVFSGRGRKNIAVLATRPVWYRDESWRQKRGFPFIAIRSYEKQRSADEEETCDPEDETPPHSHQTIIYWTSNAGSAEERR